jgi:hypothetical protein
MRRLLSLLLLFPALPGIAYGDALDPPEQVARLSFVSGEVLLRPATASAFSHASLNWPVSAGDRVATDDGDRAELSFASGTLRLDSGTDVTVLALDRSVATFLLAMGTIGVHVRELRRGEALEVKLGTLTAQLLTPGDYRLTLHADGTARVLVETGEAKLDTAVATVQQLGGEEAQIEADGTVSIARGPQADGFDRWSRKRGKQLAATRSAQHVPRGLVGFEELDRFGKWRWEPRYGMVWEPDAPDWAPYRFGQWIWKEPWGWTWVDAAPWGFAVSHYGRWLLQQKRWLWLPGPRPIPPVYAPALVRWIEPPADLDRIGWAPLAPYEPYEPEYRASERHVRQLNTFAKVFDRDATATEAPIIPITWMARSALEKRRPSSTAERIVKADPAPTPVPLRPARK